ncbi:MAG: DsrE family protein [Sandarakinorhabdus sp.]|nr:DsrE family protein [Sandarakinorhabdus sp.]
MSGLLVIVSDVQGERFAAAVELAAAAAALDRPVAMLLRGAAVHALDQPHVAKAFELLFELGAEVGICQTAMAAYGLAAPDLPPGAKAHGMVAFLSGRANWQLAIV